MLLSVVANSGMDTAEHEVSAMADTLEKVHLLNELRESVSSPPASPLVTPSTTAARATSGNLVPQPPAVDPAWRPEVTWPQPAPRAPGGMRLGGMRRTKPPHNWNDSADRGAERDNHLKRASRSPLQASADFGGGASPGAMRRTKVRRFSAEAAFPSVDNLQSLLGEATAFEVSSQQNAGASPAESLRRCASVPSLHAANEAAAAVAATAAGQPPAVASTDLSAVSTTMGPPPCVEMGASAVAPWQAYRAWVKENPRALKHECKSYLNTLLAGSAQNEAAGAAKEAPGYASSLEFGPVTM